MKNVINKIFLGEADEEVHSDFVKFSRGVFENRYLIECRKQAAKWAVKTSAEFANYFVRRCLEKAVGSLKIKGAIICTFSLEGKIKVERVKQFAGVKQHLIDSEFEPGEILKLMDEFPRAFYALTFSSESCELKIKAKAPKSGKPGKKSEDGPKADFCSLKTNDFETVKDLLFDFSDFREIKVKHTIEIKEIELPKEISEPKEIREKSIRKGVVKRFVNVDGKEFSNEKEFSA